MKRTTKIALGMSVMLAVGFGIGAGRGIAALAERKQSAVTDRGTVYEYQTGSMTLVQNAYGGSIFADFDAVNVNALADARRYALLAPEYTYAVGGVTLTGIDAQASGKYLVLRVHNLLCAEKSITISVNDTAMDSGGYYLDGQYDSVRAYEGEAVKLPVYQNPKVTKANMGFSGEVIIPVSAFAGVTKIQSITLSAALSQTNFNVGEAYLADFDAAAMTLSDKVSVWTPSETNWERYEESLDKSGNSYTAEDIFAVTPLRAGESIFTACYAQSALDTAARNYFFWQFPEEMIDGEDSLVHLKDLNVKGMAIDVAVPEGTPSLQLAIRLGGADNPGLDYKDGVTVYQTSNALANQSRILPTGLVKGGNTSYLPSGAFEGTIYIPFTKDSFTGKNNNVDPDVVMPVIWVDYNNSSLLTEKESVRFSNCRFVTDDTPYQPNLITMVSANGLLEGSVGEVPVGSDSNNKVLAGTEVAFKVTPNKGYGISSVTVTEEGKDPVSVQTDEEGGFVYTVNAPVTVMASYEITQYKVTYELNGGTNAAGNLATYTYLRGFELSDPTKENAEFMGWYTNPSFLGEAVTEIADGTTGDLTLYAMWKENSASGDSSDGSSLNGSASSEGNSGAGCGSSLFGMGSSLILLLGGGAAIYRRRKRQ